MALYYSTQLALPMTTNRVIEALGFNPDTHHTNILKDQYNLFLVNTTPVPVLNTNLYKGYTAAYTANVDGYTYDQSFTPIKRPLADAQALIIEKLKDTAEADSIVALGGVAVPASAENSYFKPAGPYKQVGGESAVILAAQSFLTASNRVEPYKSISTSVNVIATALNTQITAVNAATTIEEVGVVGTTLTGILFTGRGSGLGPDDLNLSHYVEFNHSTLDQSETELFVPSTSTVIPYTAIANNNFDSAGNCFDGTNYEIQIRETSSSIVLAEFVVPLNASGENLTF